MGFRLGLAPAFRFRLSGLFFLAAGLAVLCGLGFVFGLDGELACLVVLFFFTTS
jgi:hypothetical protein